MMVKEADAQPEDFGNRLARLSALWGTIAVTAVLPFVAYLSLYKIENGQRYYLKIATFAVFAVFLFGRAVGRIDRIRIDVPLVAVAMSFVFVTGSNLISPSPAYGMSKASLWFAGIAYFLMLRHVYRYYDLFKIFSWIFVVQAGLLAAYGIGQERFGLQILPYYEEVPKNWVIATFGHPNFFGSFMGPVLFLCLARAVAPGFLPGRIAAGVVSLVVIYGIYLARSRAVWIGGLIGVILIVLLMFVACVMRRVASPRRRWTILIAGALFVIFLVGGTLFIPHRGRNFVQGKVNALLSRSQWENRLYYWYIATGLKPPLQWFGIGMGGFGQRFWAEIDAHQDTLEGRYFTRNLIAMQGAGFNRALDPENVHNDYLQMWVESGAGALFAHLLLAGYLIYFFIVRQLGRGMPTRVPLRHLLVKFLLLGGFACALFDAGLGFPLILPCSLLVFWFYCALLNQSIDVPEI